MHGKLAIMDRDDGSSTESEYDEDAEYDDLEQQQLVALHDADEEESPHGNATFISLSQPDAPAVGPFRPMMAQRTIIRVHFDDPLPPSVEASPSCFTVTPAPVVPEQAVRPFDLDCAHCGATVTVAEVDDLFKLHRGECHCCRIQLGSNTYEVEHVDIGPVWVRMCK